jgi:hypothetical protein
LSKLREIALLLNKNEMTNLRRTPQ